MLDVLRRAMNNVEFDRSSSAALRNPPSVPQTAAAPSSTALVDAQSIARLQRKQKLLDLCLFVVDCCLRNGTESWWRQAVSLPFADIAQGVEHLKELCLQELVYDAGDVRSFCRAYEVLEEEGYLEGDDRGRFLLDLLRFVQPSLGRVEEGRKTFGDQLRSLATKKGNPGAVVSVVIPDDRSFSSFMELCFPSLGSDGAFTLLCSQREVTFLLSVCQHRAAEVEAHLRQRVLDCTIVCQPIPENLGRAAARGEVERDWLVGALQYLHLEEARRRDADFLSVNPNAIYAAGFFKQVLQLAEDKSEILSAVVWLPDRGFIDRELKRNETDGSASIPAGILTHMGLVVSAPASCTTFVEGFVATRGPTAHLRLTWTGKDHVDIYTTCHEIVFLARTSLKKMSRRFSLRPSAELDTILGDDAVPHFVAAEDGIVIAEFGLPPGGFDDIAGDPAKFPAFVARLLRPRQAAFFRQPVRLAVSRPADEPADDPADALRSAFLTSLQKANDPATPTVDQALSALNALHQYETSEYGLENMAGAIAEGRRLVDICPSAADDLDVAARKVLIRAAVNVDHVDKAISLANGGGQGTSFAHDFLVKMMELKAANVRQARRLRRKFFLRRSFAVMGSIAWGEAFVDKFMNYHVPSLLAEGNIPALARRKKVIHSIVTTERDRQRIVAHPVFRRLSRFAEVVFTCFPEELLERRARDKYNFYYFYGFLDHQSVLLAQALQAELYLLPIDIVISRGSLANVGRSLDKGADCCSIAGIECEPADLRSWLDGRARSKRGELDLPADELLTAAIAMPDAYCRSLVMSPDNQAFCRHARELIWPMRDGLVIHSIFMHPVAISARLMSRPFHPQYENVDYALLPRLLQHDGRLTVLQNAELAAAQFGAPAGREEFLDTGFSLEAFIDAHEADYAAQRRCFASRQFFPSGKVPYPPSADCAQEVALIEAALKRYRFRNEQA
ncbi:hypothetical protein SAMN02990966_06974 [Rhodospirillales bacterium URHD0017]|nr:hypothetical protein SAMN02990966_06974 [Rhodospirillales bacterium URHD0017]